MSFKTIAGRFNGAFRWYGALSEDQENFYQIYQNYLVVLIQQVTAGVMYLFGKLCHQPISHRQYVKHKRHVFELRTSTNYRLSTY